MSFVDELTALLNRYRQENDSDTPDWILADYLVACLYTWNAGLQQREAWYGRPIGQRGVAIPTVPPPQEKPR